MVDWPLPAQEVQRVPNLYKATSKCYTRNTNPSIEIWDFCDEKVQRIRSWYRTAPKNTYKIYIIYIHVKSRTKLTINPFIRSRDNSDEFWTDKIILIYHQLIESYKTDHLSYHKTVWIKSKQVSLYLNLFQEIIYVMKCPLGRRYRAHLFWKQD